LQANALFSHTIELLPTEWIGMFKGLAAYIDMKYQTFFCRARAAMCGAEQLTSLHQAQHTQTDDKKVHRA